LALDIDNNMKVAVGCPMLQAALCTYHDRSDSFQCGNMTRV